MNSTLQALAALVSGAFLSLGLNRLSEIFDPLARESAVIDGDGFAAALPCVGPACEVPAEISVAS